MFPVVFTVQELYREDLVKTAPLARNMTTGYFDRYDQPANLPKDVFDKTISRATSGERFGIPGVEPETALNLILFDGLQDHVPT